MKYLEQWHHIKIQHGCRYHGHRCNDGLIGIAVKVRPTHTFPTRINMVKCTSQILWEITSSDAASPLLNPRKGYALAFWGKTKNKNVFVHVKLKQIQTNLTLKWSKYSVLPLVVKGGSLWTLTQKSTFPNEFGGEMRVTDKVIQKNQNRANKIENRTYNYKMPAKKKNNLHLAT